MRRLCPTPTIEIRPVVQAGKPEDESNQDEENKHRHRDDLRREAEGGCKGVGRGVTNDTVDVPVLAEPGPDVAHQPHQPGEGDRDEDQHVLGDRRHPAPARFAGVLRLAEQEDVDRGDGHHGKQDRADLRHREADSDARLHEVPVDAKEDDEDRRGRKDQELYCLARLRPRHGRDPPRPAVEQEAHEGREDEDVHGGVLRGHHTKEAQNRVRPSAHRPDLGDRRDDRPGRRPDHETEHDRGEQVLDEPLERLRPFDAPMPSQR